MSVNIIIVTHENLGSAILNAVKKTFGKLPLPTFVEPIDYDCNPDAIIAKLKTKIKQLNNHDGILILTDLFGSTPSNIAQALQNNVKIKVVAGINLPMLIRVMNYPALSLSKLAEKALSGGRDGILNCAECA